VPGPASARVVGAALVAALLVGCGGDPPAAGEGPDAAPSFDPAATALEPEEAPPLRYEVQPGDTLWDIAERHGTTVEALVEANPLASPDDLTPGQVLVVPRG